MSDHPLTEKLLSEFDFDRIVMSLPDIRDRAALWTHEIARTQIVKETLAGHVTDSDSSAAQAERARIVQWLRTVPGASDTVRGNAAKKLADRIEAGEHSR